MGVVAPNGNGLSEFELALRKGKSGLRANAVMEESGFGCRVAGVPQGVDEIADSMFEPDQLLAMNSGHRYASIAAVDAWTDAGLPRPPADDERVDWESGAVIGCGIGGMDTIGEKVVPLVDARKARRLGSTAVEQVMASGVSARISGLLALGNQVTTNSSACSTGTEAVSIAFERIRSGLARRMLCGGMSASAGGFIPAAGAGVLLLESLESARQRGARIYAELLGSAVNCGGHRGGGSMTAPNPESVQRCVRAALADGDVAASAVDVINGHLTATGADPGEVRSWAAALERTPETLPPITSTKSMIGHALGAAGGIECVATVLMVHGGFVHPSINCEDVHPEIEPYAGSIPHALRELPGLRVGIKAGFGFGDVNACVVFRKWEP
jgi:3-oxoacyl-(acyl-carrier-protein) synthase